MNSNELQTNRECDKSLVFETQTIDSIVYQIRSEEKIEKILDYDIHDVMSALKVLIEAEHMNGMNIQYNALLVMKSVLSSKSYSLRKERALMFASDEELLKNLLHFEEYLIENDVKNELMIETYYHIMNKLSIHKILTKKISAIHKPLDNCLYVLERWKHRSRIVSAILCYIKHLLKNSLFASILCTQNTKLSQKCQTESGLLDIIHDILKNHKPMSYSSIYSIETLASICRCKEGITELLKKSSYFIQSLVKHFDECILTLNDIKSDSKRVMKFLRFSFSVLNVFLHFSYIMSEREKLIHLYIDQKVLSFMKTIVDNKTLSEKSQHLDRVFILSSLLIQRLSDPLPLPLSSSFNPNSFEIPLIENLIHKSNRNSNGNECNIDENIDDYHSDGTDSDEDSMDQNEDELIHLNPDNKTFVSYEQYFPEIKHFEWDLTLKPKNCFANESKDETNGNKERKKSKENIKSLFCGCFSNHQNNDNSIVDNSEHFDENEMDFIYGKDVINCVKEDKTKEPFMESADWRQIYTSLAIKTKSIQPIVTLVEPELSANIGNDTLEPLASFDSKDLNKTARIKLLEHISQRYERKMFESIVIYDIEFRTNKLNENKLHFESRFESGNLRKVIQNELSSNEYTLLLNTDTNTSSHVQWFYFRVSNMKSNIEYVFNVINCEKQSSLFNEGQRPVMFSTKESQICDKPFWKRVGHSVAYYRNHYLKDDSISSLMNGKSYYTLTFKMQFPFENDVCFLAFSYPHSYTYLNSCIHLWQNCHNSCNVFFKHQTLCTSLAGNDVPVLTITSSKPSENRFSRQYVVLLGRVHPSETNSSWILKGCIDFLLSGRMSAQRLLQKYVFKIIPMTNPDGVINGNTRCGAQGVDLNRQWRRPDPLLYPIQFHIKSLIEYLSRISNNSNPVVLVDFHGHSRRKNIFVYGCSSLKSWKGSDRNKCQDQSYLALPLILNSIAPAFSLENCCFNIEENRERTARITLWRQLGLRASYTLECSQAGCDVGPYEGMHLGINQLTEMGFKFCSALLRLDFTYDSDSCQPIAVIPKDVFIDSKDIKSNGSQTDSSEDTIEDNDSF